MFPRAGQPGHGRTTSLRRQSSWIAQDRKSRHTGLFELICCDCGDHPYLQYSDIPPRLQQIRGPYTLEAPLWHLPNIQSWFTACTRPRPAGQALVTQ